MQDNNRDTPKLGLTDHLWWESTGNRHVDSRHEGPAMRKEYVPCRNVIMNKYPVTVLNLLCPSDAIWRHRSRSALAQVMVSCLKAQSHYLKQCWLIIKGFAWHSLDTIFTGSAQDIISKISFKNISAKSLPYFPGSNELCCNLLTRLSLFQ